MSFQWLFYGQYCQEPYLEPNQKSIVELFVKIVNKFQLLTFLAEKAPP